MQPCTRHQDTVCGSREELEEQRRGQGDQEYGGLEEQEEEGVMHYESMDTKEAEEEVFGERMLAEGGGNGGRSPTRAILAQRMEERGDTLKHGRLEGGGRGGEQYGLPTFFQEDEDGGQNSVVEQGERPILEVVKEFLTTNSTLSPTERKGVARWSRRGGRKGAKGDKRTQGFQAEQALEEERELTTRRRRARSTTAAQDMEDYDGIEHNDLDTGVSTTSAGDSAFRSSSSPSLLSSTITI